ncbi:c-type cytochrome [Herbaspirillum lusitanum]|uniref:C-type cytochrome n=1 Tax=Herbaspirillum lusitanum TaxID=213312 RepID=A0ABW9AC31_9BURK
MHQRLIACTACHGKQGRAAADGYYPRLAGKPEGYLFNQLQNFRDGRRQYPLMTYMLANMSDDYLHEIARYFSEQHPPYPAPAAGDASAAMLERGRLLVHHGDAAKKIPACIACHGQALTGLAPAVPGLIGVPRDYISAQLGAWKNGLRQARQPDCMSHIARQLTLEDVSALSAWLSGQPVPPGAQPATTLPASMPLACGGVPQSGTTEGSAR